MMDLERLTEALKQPIFPPGASSQGGVKEADWIDAMHLVNRAARAYRDLLANGERVEWCETHFDTWATVGACRNGLGEAESHRCVKVSKLLIPSTEED